MRTVHGERIAVSEIRVVPQVHLQETNVSFRRCHFGADQSRSCVDVEVDQIDRVAVAQRDVACFGNGIRRRAEKGL